MPVVGTAGHVDHGKTMLVRALTGTDTDRLPEEKRRGLTIELGFAHFVGHDGHIVGVVDVPGHERFIRNMVAGAWGLDCALLTVAADEGWMPQTEDHARVLACMQTARLIVVVTKAARSLGVDTRRLQWTVVAAVAVAMAAVTSVGGVVGFVGLVAPTLTRRFMGAKHRPLLVGSALSGALLTVLADAVARTTFAPTELPIGVITVGIGAPVFLAVLLGEQKAGRM